ncbi:hypothetical protein [Paraclostridium dentum]|uniref:hypothetical protein n=1 Tax=Paraclostridium dentum TaxID=2662455 RepID=UPI003F34FC44
MHNVFNVTSVSSDYTNKQIIIQTNFTVEPSTVNKKNIQISSASSGTTVIYKLTIDNDKIIASLKDWPDLDTYYEVRITGIKDKLDRDLVHPITKNIVFKDDTKFKVIIKSPNNNEAVIKQHNLVHFSIVQINPDGSEISKPIPDSETENPSLPNKDITGSMFEEAILEDESDVTYHFEFASDVAFFNVVKDYKTSYTEGCIELESGQYYMRSRPIENETKLGDWSETITFTVVPDACENELEEILQSKKEYIDDILAPVEFFLDGYEEDLKILSQSGNGISYPEFYIEFNKDIDTTKLPETVFALRRDL